MVSRTEFMGKRKISINEVLIFVCNGLVDKKTMEIFTPSTIETYFPLRGNLHANEMGGETSLQNQKFVKARILKKFTVAPKGPNGFGFLDNHPIEPLHRTNQVDR